MKYSEEDLRAMSIALLRYKAEGSKAYVEFIHIVAMLTRTSLHEVDARITEYAKEEG
jgi:hypothetical protein